MFVRDCVNEYTLRIHTTVPTELHHERSQARLRKEEGRAWGQHPHLVKKTTLQKHAQQMKIILLSWER